MNIARRIGVGVSATIFLLLCGWLGNHLTLCTYLTSPGACPGKLLCWGGVTGVAIGALLLGLFFKTTKGTYRHFMLPCVAAAVLAGIAFGSHMIQTFCF